MGMGRAHLTPSLYPPETVRSVCGVEFLLDIPRACKHVLLTSRANHLSDNTCSRGCTATLTFLLEAGRRENCEGGGTWLPDLLDLRVDGQEVGLAVNLLIDLSPDQGGQE